MQQTVADYTYFLSEPVGYGKMRIRTHLFPYVAALITFCRAMNVRTKLFTITIFAQNSPAPLLSLLLAFYFTGVLSCRGHFSYYCLTLLQLHVASKGLKVSCVLASGDN